MYKHAINQEECRGGWNIACGWHRDKGCCFEAATGDNIRSFSTERLSGRALLEIPCRQPHCAQSVGASAISSAVSWQGMVLISSAEAWEAAISLPMQQQGMAAFATLAVIRLTASSNNAKVRRVRIYIL